uniref:Uncharacterized protein n=1 Tax=Thermocrinis ruber TaxID=75906 RepID=A0A7C5WYZ5_9AQUI
MTRAKVERLIKELEDRKSFYERSLRKGERRRKRERDQFLTEKDRTILVESFVLGGIIENLITKVINRLF